MKVFKYIGFGEWGQEDIDHNKELARQMLTQKKAGNSNIPASALRKLYQSNISLNEMKTLRDLIDSPVLSGDNGIHMPDKDTGVITLFRSPIYAAGRDTETQGPAIGMQGSDINKDISDSLLSTILTHEKGHLLDQLNKTGSINILESIDHNSHTATGMEPHEEWVSLNDIRNEKLDRIKRWADETNNSQVLQRLKKLNENRIHNIFGNHKKADHGSRFYNRASIQERRADNYSLTNKNLRDRIAVVEYLKLHSPSLSWENSDPDEYEPMRVKSIIRNSFNDLTKNSTNPNKGKAEIAKKWIESGVLGPQLTRNMQGLVDHYNKTGEWFGYFSERRGKIMKFYLFSDPYSLHRMKKNWKGKGIYRKITQDGKDIGRIGISRYKDIKALGIGSFEINPDQRRKGHAENFLKQYIDANKDKYDLIYCYVNESNKPAIGLYNKIGKVGDKIVNHDPKTGEGQYMVELYKKKGYEY